MKLFTCSACREIAHFENSQCTRCGHVLAFLPDRATLTALEPAPGSESLFVTLGSEAKRTRYRPCGNQLDHGACNWTVPEGDDHRFCPACRLNALIPDLSDAKAKEAWL